MVMRWLLKYHNYTADNLHMVIGFPVQTPALQKSNRPRLSNFGNDMRRK